MARAKKKTFTVTIKLSTGMVLKREVVADDGACALGVVIDSFGQKDRDFAAMSVVPLRENETGDLRAERRATDAVRKLLDQGLPHELCGIGVVEAYAQAIAEGSR